jgi:predicted DNA-binding transcriptional regulator YafY
MQPWELGDEPPRQARVLVDADQAAWAVHTIGPAALEHPDGSIELELTVTNEAAFRSFVCGFLDHAEVLAPPDLRDDLIDWLTAMTESARPS